MFEDTYWYGLIRPEYVTVKQSRRVVAEPPKQHGRTYTALDKDAMYLAYTRMP